MKRFFNDFLGAVAFAMGFTLLSYLWAFTIGGFGVLFVIARNFHLWQVLLAWGVVGLVFAGVAAGVRARWPE